MKRVHKNILGVSGLVLVAGMTACAALMPSSEASATSTSVTDTLVVKVIDDRPVISLWSDDGERIVSPSYTYNVSYNHAQSVSVTLSYTDQAGVNHTAVIYRNDDADMQYNELLNQHLDLVNFTFGDGTTTGYGHYTIKATTISTDGTEYFDVLNFIYAPISIGDIKPGGDGSGEDCEVGDEDCEGSGNEGGSSSVPSIWVDAVSDKVNLIIVRTKDGRVVGMKEGDFSLPEYANGFWLPLEWLHDVECQTDLYVDVYHVVNGERGDPLYTWEIHVNDTCTMVPETGAPDTGGLFQDLNISKEDYLITGLMVFFILGIVGFGVVARSRKTSTVNRKRR